MNYCPSCGASSQPGQSFCPSCGQPILAPSAEPSAPRRIDQPTQPAEPAQPGYAQPTHGQAPSGPPQYVGQPAYVPSTSAPINLSWLIRGNWLGAMVTAIVGYAIAFAGAFGLVMLWNPDHTGVWDTLVATTVVATSAFRAAGALHSQSSGFSVDVVLDSMPLIVTLLSMGAAVLVFRRITRGYPKAGAAIVDAARAALFFGVLMLTSALVFREKSDGALQAIGLSFSSDEKLKWGASGLGSFFLTTLVLFVVLTISCFLRRDWLHPKLQQVHDWLAAPLAGVGAFTVLLPLVGAIGLACTWLTLDTGVKHDLNGSTDWSDRLAAMTAGVANAGFHFSVLGSGGHWGGRGFVHGAGYQEHGSEIHRLSYWADYASGLWAAIPVAILLALASAWFVYRRARSTGHPFANLMIWAALMLAWVPWLAHLTSARAYAHGKEPGKFAEGVWGGVSAGDSMLLALIVLAAALLMAVVTGSIDLKKIAGQLQSNPAVQSTGQAPPWSGQQPQQTGPDAQAWGQERSTQPAQQPGGQTQQPSTQWNPPDAPSPPAPPTQ